MLPTNYTWLQFKTKVLELLPVDARRKGVGNTQTLYLDGLIKQAIVRLQTCVDELRLNHETVYELSDLVQEGCAMRAVKPPQSVLRGVYWSKYDTDTETCTRFPTRLIGWDERFALVNGGYGVNDQRGIVCIDPGGYTFYVYPVPPDGECWRISVFWDGLKFDFNDAEEVLFDDAVVGAVQYFLKAMISLEVDEDPAKHREWMGLFKQQITTVAIREKDKRTMLESGAGGTPSECEEIDLMP